MSSATATKKVKLDESIKRAAKPKKPEFAGKLDSELYTQNGGVMTLFVTCCSKILPGQKANVSVDILELDTYFNQNNEEVKEGSEDDLLATFEGVLENKGGKFFFSEMKATKEVDWEGGAFCPYVFIAFAGENDVVSNTSKKATEKASFPVIVNLKEGVEENEGDVYEIGFIIKKGGAVIGSSGKTASMFYGKYTTSLFLDCFDMRTQIDSVNLLNITHAQFNHAASDVDGHDELTKTAVASTTSVYQSSVTAYNEKKLKSINNALKVIDNLIKTSKNPYFQNIQTVNEYYQNLETYKGQVEQYQKMQQSDIYVEGDCYSLENALIQPTVQKLNNIESTVHDYLKMSGNPPKAYKDRIDKNIAIITRNTEINKILNNPAVQMMGLLPGAGVITGTLKLIKGDYFGGFLDVFGAVVTYGGFLKLSRVARAFRKSSTNTVELLYSYRYRKLVSSITSVKAMDKLVETSMKQSGPFLGDLFTAVGSFKSLRGHVDSIALLHRNKEYILDMTQRAIKGIDNRMITDAKSYIEFLRKLGNTNATAEFFAHLRVLHATVKGGKSMYAATLEAMEEVNKLLGYKELPGVNEFNPLVVENITTLFRMLRNMGVDIDNVVTDQTKQFTSTSSIIETFNESLAQYDNFGLNKNADVRYQNSKAEMLLALDEISDRWSVEKSDRDNWIAANRHLYSNQDSVWLEIQWARNNKKSYLVSLPDSLESRISNFMEKLEGQIALREAFTGQSELGFLKSQRDAGVDQKTNLLYDFNAAFFYFHGSNLVERYY